jgi:hypothetical protein
MGVLLAKGGAAVSALDAERAPFEDALLYNIRLQHLYEEQERAQKRAKNVR